MQLIDEEGNLFGFVNVADALVVLAAVAIGVTTIAIVTGPSGASETATVTYESAVPSAVADAVGSDRATLSEGAMVAGPTVLDTWTNETNRQNFSRIQIEARVPVSVSDDGSYRSKGRSLYIGGEQTLDFGVTRFEATITEIET